MTPELIQEADDFQRLQKQLSDKNASSEQIQRAGSALLPYLFHSDAYWRARAARVFSMIQERAFWAYPALVEQLTRDTNERVTLLLIEGLSHLKTPNDEITEGLLEVIRATKLPTIKKAAIEALGPVATFAALPTLREALADEYLAPAALFSLYCLGAEGREQIEENQMAWWRWSVFNAKEKLAGLSSLSPSLAEWLIDTAPLEILRQVARHQSVPTQQLDELAKHPDNAVRVAIASNASTSLDALRQLCHDGFEGVRCAVASNTNITHDLVDLLRQDTSKFVRLRLASNDSISEEMALDFAHSESSDERCRVALNQKLPLEELWRLAKDPELKVRSAVARGAHTPPEILEALSLDEAEDVHIALSFRDDCPRSVVEKLIPMQQMQAGLVITSSLSTQDLSQLAENVEEDARADLALLSDAPGWLLRKLATDPSAEVRRQTARNYHVTDDFLEILSLDVRDEVRRAVASKASTKLAERFLQYEPFDAVLSELGSNPRLSPQLIDALLSRGVSDTFLAAHPDIPMRCLLSLTSGRQYENRKYPLEEESFPPLEELSRHGRWALARNRHTPAHILERLSQDRDEHTRQYVAQNTSTPLEALRQLKQDSATRVIEALISNANLASSEREELVPKLGADNYFSESLYR